MSYLYMCCTIYILEELRLVEELWDQLLEVRATLVDVPPRAWDGEELAVSKIKPVYMHMLYMHMCGVL